MSPDPRHADRPTQPDFGVCPHCWHLNGPGSRICLRCRADMTTVLQESGGERWAAAVQSPVPIRAAHRLTRVQRAVLFGFLLLFGLSQLLIAVAPRGPVSPPAAVPGGR